MSAKKFIITALAAYTGYEIYQLSELVKKFDYKIRNVKIKKGNTGTLVFSFIVDFVNNANVSLPVRTVGGTIQSMNGTYIGRFSNKNKVVLKANDTTSFEVDVLVSSYSLIRNLVSQIANNNSKFIVNFDISLLPRIAFVIPVPVPIKRKVEIDLRPYITDITQMYSFQNDQVNQYGNELVKLLDAGLELVDAIKLLKKK